MALSDLFSGIIPAGTNPADPTSTDTIARRRKMAEALMRQGMDYSPVQSWAQGASRVSQALLGAFDDKQLDTQEKNNNDYWSKALTGASGPAASPAPAPSGAAAALSGGGNGAVAPDELAPLIQKASAQTGIPVPVLTAQIKQESGFNPNATGKAGEIGLMQIMPSTAKDPGFGMKGIDPSALRDPETNIMFGANYLKARGGKVDYNDPSNVAKALANYNGGGDPNYVSNVTRFMPGQGGGGQQQPTQVAQNGPPSGMMGLGTGQGQPNQQQLLAIIANPNAPAGIKQAATLMYQQGIKDPLQEATLAEKRANTAKTQAELANMDKTGDIKEYNLAVQQGEKRPFTEWAKDMKRSAAPSVNIDQKSETALANQQGTGLGKRLNDIADEGGKAQEDSMLYGRFGQLLDGVQTGKKTQVLEAVRQLTGVTLDPNTDNVQALNSAIQYLAPRLRVAGSGSQSDTELRNFMQSVPSLAGTPGGNKQIMQTLQGMVQYRQQRAEIAQAWQTGDLSAKEATDKINKLQSPFSPPVKIDASMGPDQVKQKYPSGTRIILPDGTPGVVP